MNHYPHHIGDFDKATRHLNRLERSIYRDLLDVYYETELPLTLELDKLKRKILASTQQESTAVEQVLIEFFLETPNGWFHSRCDVEILKFQDNTTQKALAGKASAAAKAARKQQALNGRLTDVERHLNGTSTNQNLEPRTNNHKPKERESGAKAPRPVKKCPDDFLITTAMNDWANDHGIIVDLKTETEKFKDYTFSRAISDWSGAWRNWMRKAQEYSEKHKPDKPYETPYAKSMREKYEKITPMIAAQNPNTPKKLNPNDFINGLGEFKNDEPKLRIAG